MHSRVTDTCVLKLRSIDSEWMTVEQDEEFAKNIEEIPLEVKSNAPQGMAGDTDSISFQGSIDGNYKFTFSFSVMMKDQSVWLGSCNNKGEDFINPDAEPNGPEVVWTFFKTSTLTWCTELRWPSSSMWFTSWAGQAAESYRFSGMCIYTIVLLIY